MTRTSTGSGRHNSARRGAWRARALVLGPLAIAALATVATLGFSTDTPLLGPLWVAAIAWTVLASLAGALLRGLRHGDWSAFGRYELPDGRDDRMDWFTQTGSYAYLRIEEDRRRHDDDWLR